jgi:hypothetical protein
MDIYAASVPQFRKMLENLDKWLEASVPYAQKKSFDPNTLLTARLAPDQYALARQVQAACDTAKSASAQLAGKQPPAHPDNEQTIDDLRRRIRTCTEYLGTLVPEDFDGAERRVIALRFREGKLIDAKAFLVEAALPSFYFHVTAAYEILRHNGLEIGMRDFMGHLPVRDP